MIRAHSKPTLIVMLFLAALAGWGAAQAESCESALQLQSFSVSGNDVTVIIDNPTGATVTSHLVLDLVTSAGSETYAIPISLPPNSTYEITATFSLPVQSASARLCDDWDDGPTETPDPLGLNARRLP